jgi:hypothetical protein
MPSRYHLEIEVGTDGTVTVEAMDGETAVDRVAIDPRDVDLNAIWDVGLSLADRYDMGADPEDRAHQALVMAGIAMSRFLKVTGGE